MLTMYLIMGFYGNLSSSSLFFVRQWLCKLAIVQKALSEFTSVDPWIGSLQEHPV